MRTDVHMRSYTPTDTQLHMRTDAHRRIHAQLHTHRITATHMHRRTAIHVQVAHARTHSATQAQMHSYTHAYSCTRTDTQLHTCTDTQPYTRRHTATHMRTDAYSLPQTLPPLLSGEQHLEIKTWAWGVPAVTGCRCLSGQSQDVCADPAHVRLCVCLSVPLHPL